MQRHRSVTLGQMLLAAAAVCLGALAIAYAGFWRSSERAALAASEQSRQKVARAVEMRVTTELGAAVEVLHDVERALSSGLVDVADRRAVEALLYTELLGGERLAEVTFTGAVPLDDAGPPSEPHLGADGRYQI